MRHKSPSASVRRGRADPREFGIRIALGADRSRVVSEVLRRGALIVGLGCAAGLAAAIAATPAIQSLLYGIP